MTNTTETYWSVNGVSLQTFCSNVESVGPKHRTPPLRGGDVTVAYRHGQRWRPKSADADTITLAMWIDQLAPDGTVGLGPERQFNKNMHDLKMLVWKAGLSQVELTKRWKDPVSGDVMSATALAEVQPIQAAMFSPDGTKMAVDFRLADPFFYGDPVTVDLAVGVAQDVFVDGESPTHMMTIEFIDQLSNATITNEAPDPDYWVRLGSAIAAGDRVMLDVDGFTAVRNSDQENLIGAVTRSGGRHWMTLWPGTNRLTLTATSGTGTAELIYRPIWL